MSTTAPERATADPALASGWVATLALRGDSAPGAEFDRRVGTVRFEVAPATRAYLAHGTGASVLFEGVLHSRRELAALCPHRPAPGCPDAELVRDAFEHRGLEALLSALRGIFALVIWDRSIGALWAARDQIGIHPLYYARSAHGIAVASRVEVLLAQPGVSRELDPVALAEYLAHRYAPDGETFYRDVRRCLPATVVRIDPNGVQARRYWDPLPDDEPVRWLSPSEAEGFEPIFTQAVRRCADGERPAIFLSGGLDSIAVAAVSTAGSGRQPLALSLGFEDPDCDEREAQRRVAAALGLDQVLLGFGEAVPPHRFVQAALAMGADWPFPMWNIWSPAYAALVSEARTRGCTAVLSGRGGDEWLTVSPFHAADLARAGNVVGLARLIRSRLRSRRHTGSRYAWELLKNRVGRPLGSAALAAVAPRWWHEQRRQRLRRQAPFWLAPGAGMRRQMDGRLDRFIIEARPRTGFYVRETKATLNHPCVTGDLEETQEFGRRLGVRMLHPFWDADVVEFLCRMPPHLLDRGGRSKAPLRTLVARRVPALGLERQRKAHALRFFDSMMRREAPAIFGALGGLRTLGALGVVDAPRAEAHLKTLLEGPSVVDPGRVVEVLTLETWARHRVR